VLIIDGDDRFAVAQRRKTSLNEIDLVQAAVFKHPPRMATVRRASARIQLSRLELSVTRARAWGGVGSR